MNLLTQTHCPNLLPRVASHRPCCATPRAPSNRQLLDQRALFVRASAPEPPATSDMALHTTDAAQHAARHRRSAVSQRFLVGQCRAGGRAADLAKHAGELFGVPLIPWCALMRV